MPTNHIVVLDNRPEGEASASNFKLITAQTPALQEGQVLVKHHYLFLHCFLVKVMYLECFLFLLIYQYQNLHHQNLHLYQQQQIYLLLLLQQKLLY